MDWTHIIKDLETKLSLAEIVEQAGLASKGHACNLKSGLQKSCSYEIGCKLVDLHRKMMRRKARRVAR